MKGVIAIIVLLAAFISGAIADSYYIMQQLDDEAGWHYYKEINGSTVRRKAIDGYDLFALEIRQIADVPPEAVFSVLLDVASYPEVLSDNEYLEAEQVAKDSLKIVGYQFAKLPLVSNRHYLFSFDLVDFKSSLTNNSQRLYWTLIEPEGIYAPYLRKKNQDNNDPVYIKDGAGLWKINNLSDGKYENIYRLYLDPAGWMPGWLVNGSNVKNLEMLFHKVISAARKEI
jgi:hypothetical protein